jgi:hypothetical protein
MLDPGGNFGDATPSGPSRTHPVIPGVILNGLQAVKDTARRHHHRQGAAGVQFAQSNPNALSFRSQFYRRGICFLLAAKQQIPRAITPRFGMTIL